MSDGEALNEQLAKLSRVLKQIERQILSGQYYCSCCGVPEMVEIVPGVELENNCILEEILRTQEANSLVDVREPEGSDDYMEVTYDKEQCLSDHYTAPVTPLAYTLSIPETDEFIKSSVDDIVPIPRESGVTSDSDLECDMPATTPLPTTDVRKENFDINSPLGEYVVDFLMENEDVAGLPRHLEFEDISSLDPESTPVIDESSLLVTPLPDLSLFVMGL
ncbi:hypothetical protein Tco_0850640 [Tanacetum coccineum]